MSLATCENPTSFFDKDGKVKLIDLDWAGRYDMKQKDTFLPPDPEQKIHNNIGRVQGSTLTEFVRYPLSLSPDISWAEGVPIRPQHDWEMLRKLGWSQIRIQASSKCVELAV